MGNNGTLKHDDDLNQSVVAGRTENQKFSETCYAEFPIHTVVLSTNSDYFLKLFSESGMKENLQQIVTVKVKYRKGIYLERMIQAFYDPAILNHQDYSDLIFLMEIGEHFLCVTFLEHCISVLETKEIKLIEDFDSILIKLSQLHLSEASINEKLQDCISECSKKLTEKLYPLELNISSHEKFMKLDFVTIKHLVTSDYATTITEDHLLLFLYKWLQYKVERQTAENIGVLLINIKPTRLNFQFVYNEIVVDDSILNKWEHYPLWFSVLMKYQLSLLAKKEYQGVGPERQKPYGDEDHNYPVIFHFVYTGEYFESKNQFVWKGVCVAPHISITNNEYNQWDVQLKFIGEKIFPRDKMQNFRYPRYFKVVYSLTATKENYVPLEERYYNYYRRENLNIVSNLEDDFRIIASVDEDFLKELKTSGLTLVLHIPGAICSVGNSIDIIRTPELLLRESDMRSI